MVVASAGDAAAKKPATVNASLMPPLTIESAAQRKPADSLGQ